MPDEPRYVHFAREYQAARQQEQIILDAARQLKTHLENLDILAQGYNDWKNWYNGSGISKDDSEAVDRLNEIILTSQLLCNEIDEVMDKVDNYLNAANTPLPRNGGRAPVRPSSLIDPI